MFGRNPWVRCPPASSAVCRATGTINFAQGERALFTTFLAWGLATKHVPIARCLLVAAAVAGFILGSVSDRVLVRPIEKRSLLAMLIVLLGLFSVLDASDGLTWGKGNQSMPSMFPSTLQSYVSVFGARLYWANIGVWRLVAAVVALMFGLFNRTRLGLQIRATANNRSPPRWRAYRSAGSSCSAGASPPRSARSPAHASRPTPTMRPAG